MSGDERWKRAGSLASLAALALLLALPLLLLPVLTGTRPDFAALAADSYTRGVVLFTLHQAALSALLSVLFAVPLAVALHRTRFPGRELALKLFLLPQALPTLVAALGILAVFGRGGVLSDLAAALGAPRLDVYGLPGILLAHVFFNMPLAARMILSALSAVPAETWKLAGQLSLSPLATFRVVEWPAIRSVVPGAASLVFMLCVTSFSLVLVLGGGPASTTMEVAIYQSLRYDFDPGRALALSIVQVGLVALIVAPALLLGRARGGAFSLGALPRRHDPRSAARALLDRGIVFLGLAFILAPFAAILLKGLSADLGALLADPAVRRAAATSLVISTLSTVLGLALSLPLALAGGGRGVAARLSGSLVLVVPPIVVGAGWFLILREFGPVSAFAPVIVVATNAAMAVPFMTRILGPAARSANTRAGRLAAHLNLSGAARLAHVEWPALRRPLGLALSLGFALSLGDLGSVALFGSPDFVTLPYLLLQRIGSYRSTDAEGLALILGALCLTLMLIAERGARERA
ncbi:thiamine/thiamine pyrophosphate ABC transporter permease ThiP [Aureimonas populi]|uniref:Thiamine/thiamine pyrophosphate ABC transporter permease ThiP n=1 Tax=Aureimonas populi TaxID=1701758 RepID=A0ABW5CIB8_9HYPH|nr:thiamine/thiamine pyrophosphate ABC transporter permease ThiP [Aureimonas populi]